MTSPTTLNFSAFDDVRRTGLRPNESDELYRETRGTRAILIVCAFLGLLAVMLLVSGVTVWGDRVTSFLIFLAVAGVPFSFLLIKRDGPARAAQLNDFARANGFAFVGFTNSVPETGSNFALGEDAYRKMRVIARINDTPVEVGNWSYKLGGRNILGTPGYAIIQLPSRLPHTIVQSARRFAPKVNVKPAAADAVLLSGAPDLHVYAPQAAHALVQSLFTRDMVALLTRLVRRYAIEIVDDQLYLFSRRPLATGSGVRWQHVFADISELTTALTTSPVWNLMGEQPKAFRRQTARLENTFNARRVNLIIWLCFGALTALIIVMLTTDAGHDLLGWR